MKDTTKLITAKMHSSAADEAVSKALALINVNAFESSVVLDIAIKIQFDNLRQHARALVELVEQLE